MCLPLAFTVAPGTTGTTHQPAEPTCSHLHSKPELLIGLLTKATPKMGAIAGL